MFREVKPVSGDKAFIQPKFRSVKALENRIEAYFTRCRGEVLTDEATGLPVLDRKGKPVIIGDHPPTQTGLALALGFPTRAAMLNYRGKPAMEALLLTARSRVEQYAEERLFDREGSAGARFTLQRRDDEAPKADNGAPKDSDDIMAEARKYVNELDEMRSGG